MNLWDGVDLKLEHTLFHYTQMVEALQPKYDAHTAARVAMGNIDHSQWQTRFYPHFDAFLMTARSVPEIVKCCFGVDKERKPMKDWYASLTAEERTRRENFNSQFSPAYQRFRGLPLSALRHVIEHRTGVALVEVIVTGYFGVNYVGTPAKRLPATVANTMADPGLPWMAQPVPVPLPFWNQFTVDGQPLFDTMQSYMAALSELVKEAREISAAVHDGHAITTPPTQLA